LARFFNSLGCSDGGIYLGRRQRRGEVDRTSNIQQPTSKPEQRLTAEKPQEGDLDKLA
jgi:hypothetical protein